MYMKCTQEAELLKIYSQEKVDKLTTEVAKLREEKTDASKVTPPPLASLLPPSDHTTAS